MILGETTSRLMAKQKYNECYSVDDHQSRYTGHEEIAEVALIHMNGRIYDQELGRFLSADPFVQEWLPNF